MTPSDKDPNGLDNPTFVTDEGEHYCNFNEGDATVPEKRHKGHSKDSNRLAYIVTDIPPWYLCIFLGIQHYLTALGGLVSIPLILSRALCLEHDAITQSHLISTFFFVSGICTLLQVLFGVRLPILQGGTFAFVTPTLAMLSLPQWQCPAWTQNATLVNATSPIFIEVWQTRMREVQGAIMIASCFQIFVGFSGLLGFLMRFIGPLTIAPTISLVALPLFDSAGREAGQHWGIAAIAMFLIVLFSQYLKNVPVPVPSYNKRKKFHFSKIYLFQIFPVLFGLILTWILCLILTVSNAFPTDSTAYGYSARTDSKGDVLSRAPWFRFPYPGQWGVPTISLAGVFGIIAGVISSMVESVGDYYACARLSGAPPPPKHAINRGIGVEGIGCLLAGAWGTGNGTTSYSENVGALGITRVGSRMVIVAGACVMLLTGLFGKIGAMFASIPTPIIGGMFFVTFGIITAVGVSNLQYVDMNSSRNLFIFGFSVFTGLTLPYWVQNNSHMLETGIVQLDQVLRVLLTTGMFVGGFLGFLLDNTIPGSKEERGIAAWREGCGEQSDETVTMSSVYDLPFGFGSKFCAANWFQYLPTCPKRPASHSARELNSYAEETSKKINSERDTEIHIDTKI
uniref:Solute carrier family 23 member 2 n=1 Tax=Anolis carolinensis TaxID=28377 RepID=G1KKW2_ANOCA|nr:PREDICTED: solute carrier family 23 member 1 isoform X1 [Anolis carolinensis]XP_016849220.1 PREDICTED: solute carrier family 23 member 1 isoform X1 [Anolis carolinensis]XP_016849221.1 PREDICTED: solute carrier family 23 member 1 isoform X1 [Anolis carolinensis]XP_016849222.1 PREDICTED: solute carrier family 23 member 1 isoform X1 [Anolis carolinensis]|eukprot:XP_003221103.1 PREDICTED: solute carrier family 23 member 1 isoform X1 [Anolis carolinensis]